MRRWVLLLEVALSVGCAPLTRVRRALAPETFVTPQTPTDRYAEVVIQTGREGDPPLRYQPEIAFEQGGEVWIRPMAVTNRGYLDILPRRPDASVEAYVRHVSVVVDPRDFMRVVARSGTLYGKIPTALRFLPSGPLGEEPMRLYLSDLNNVYSDDRLEDGDLLLLEVGAVGEEPDRYLFRALRFGIHTRGVAGVLLRAPLPFAPRSGDQPLSPALTASLAVGYRFRPQTPVARFLSERAALMASVGIGTVALEEGGEGGLVDRAVDALLIGGGIEGFRMLNVQILGSLPSLLERGDRTEWTLAVGFDAVQLARFASHLDLRLWQEQPLREDAR